MVGPYIQLGQCIPQQRDSTPCAEIDPQVVVSGHHNQTQRVLSTIHQMIFFSIIPSSWLPLSPQRKQYDRSIHTFIKSVAHVTLPALTAFNKSHKWIDIRSASAAASNDRVCNDRHRFLKKKKKKKSQDTHIIDVTRAHQMTNGKPKQITPYIALLGATVRRDDKSKRQP